jgi:endonuclease-3 related protein
VNTTSSNITFLNFYKTLFKTFGSQHWWPGETPFEIMVGAILTQNTNWRNASAAIESIKNAGLMHPKRLLAHHRRIPTLIRTSGFYRAKSKYLRSFLRYYVNEYGGNIKKMSGRGTHVLRKELLALTGIGPETADSMLLYALGRKIFVVDAYTRRIFSRHGLIDADGSYDNIQKIIQQNLPASSRLFNEYHALLVRVGKTYCRKNDPLCDACPLGTTQPRTR